MWFWTMWFLCLCVFHASGELLRVMDDLQQTGNLTHSECDAEQGRTQRENRWLLHEASSRTSSHTSWVESDGIPWTVCRSRRFRRGCVAFHFTRTRRQNSKKRKMFQLFSWRRGWTEQFWSVPRLRGRILWYTLTGKLENTGNFSAGHIIKFNKFNYLFTRHD